MPWSALSTLVGMVDPNSGADPDRPQLGNALLRAWRRRLWRRADGAGSEPELSRGMRRALRIALRRPERPIPVGDLSWQVPMLPDALVEQAQALSATGLVVLAWRDGRRCLRITPEGAAQLPEILRRFRSQALPLILLREGPRAARFAWAVRRRRRKWEHSPEQRARRERDESKRGPRIL